MMFPSVDAKAKTRTQLIGMVAGAVLLASGTIFTMEIVQRFSTDATFYTLLLVHAVFMVLLGVVLMTLFFKEG